MWRWRRRRRYRLSHTAPTRTHNHLQDFRASASHRRRAQKWAAASASLVRARGRNWACFFFSSSSSCPLFVLSLPYCSGCPVVIVLPKHTRRPLCKRCLLEGWSRRLPHPKRGEERERLTRFAPVLTKGPPTTYTHTHKRRLLLRDGVVGLESADRGRALLRGSKDGHHSHHGAVSSRRRRGETRKAIPQKD